MHAGLERLNDEADRIDTHARADIARRAEDARDLRGRCAPYRAVVDLDQAAPEPLPVVGLSVLACAILALVEHFVRLGHAGLQVARKDLSWLYNCSDSSIKRALAELRDGWLIVTPDYVPAEESALGGRYVGSRGRYRSLLSEDAEAYGNSRVRNLYTLGTKAHAAGLGKRCGQLDGQKPDPAGDPATCSALFSGSGDPDRSANLLSRRDLAVVDNPPVGPEIEGSAPSARSTLPLDEHDGDSLLEAARVRHESAPLVADAPDAVLADGDGDGSEGIDGKSPRRGLFGAMGWRLSRFLRGGAS